MAFSGNSVSTNCLSTSVFYFYAWLIIPWSISSTWLDVVHNVLTNGAACSSVIISLYYAPLTGWSESPSTTSYIYIFFFSSDSHTKTFECGLHVLCIQIMHRNKSFSSPRAQYSILFEEIITFPPQVSHSASFPALSVQSECTKPFPSESTPNRNM